MDTFQNLKAVYLPTASDGYYIPTNAVVIEDFSEYADPTAFTNGSPTTTWSSALQARAMVVAAAGKSIRSMWLPIWTNVPMGPTNWFVWNWDAYPATPGFDPTMPGGEAYANFLCVDLTTFSGIESSSLNTAPGEMINGQTLTALIFNPGQNVLMAESDNRSGSLIPGQTSIRHQQTV